MIDPTNITNYNLTDAELETILMFWVLAAGKSGTRAAEITNDIRAFWDTFDKNATTFIWLMHYDLDGTIELLRQYKTGCHNNKARTLWQLCREDLNLRTCTAKDLESIYGIGMKTSRCFIIHSRPDAQYAGLDTHALKFLRSKGVDAPLSTPSSRKKYLELEKIFLTYAKESGKMVAQFDLDIWNYYSGGNV